MLCQCLFHDTLSYTSRLLGQNPQDSPETLLYYGFDPRLPTKSRRPPPSHHLFIKYLSLATPLFDHLTSSHLSLFVTLHRPRTSCLSLLPPPDPLPSFVPVQSLLRSLQYSPEFSVRFLKRELHVHYSSTTYYV